MTFARGAWHAVTPALGVVLALVALVALGAVSNPAAAGERPGEGPPDLTPYQRPLLPGEGRALPKLAGGSLVDLVVSAGLGATDTINDSETSIAIDPNNPQHIAISAFSGGWGASSPLWTSTDGGLTWTKSYSVAEPPSSPDAAGCPCDQTLDYGKSAPVLYGTFLGIGRTDEEIWSGATGDPTAASSWQWLLGSGTAAATTSHTTFADQPWLIAALAPTPQNAAGQDDVFVAYTDYDTFPPANHVAFSLGATPPDFPSLQDIVVSTSANTGFIASAAIRLAAGTAGGAVYAAWEDGIQLDVKNCAKRVSFRLSRSLDHGQTWSLNGSPDGIQVAAAESDEGQPDDPNQPPTACHGHVEKFGTVNALLGGSEAIAVDAASGDVYYVFHNRDFRTGQNRLSVAHLTATGAGNVRVAASSFLTGQVQAALPAVAVAANGTVGVLYDTFDGMSAGFPKFSVHLAQSNNHGATWSTQTIVSFLSPATDNGNRRQRVLGDYQQLKASGNTFYAAFPANGAAAGRAISNIDPFFLALPAKPRHAPRSEDRWQR
jgi:hypothetical protein